MDLAVALASVLDARAPAFEVPVDEMECIRKGACIACVFVVPAWLVGLTSGAATVPVLDLVEPPAASQSNP